RVGQWPHWYSCKKDGAQLRTDSPTEHRCPVCGAVYRGDPYDAVVVSRFHNQLSSATRALGLAYRFTGRAEFARRAARILSDYADRYRNYPRHDVNGEDNVRGGRIMSQTLDESTWLIPVVWGYALIRDTLTDVERLHIENGLLKPAANAIREHRMAIHNIQCWKNSAVGLVGFATGDAELVRDAIDNPDYGFHAQIAKGVTGDGLWWEGSLGYHAYTMQALWPLAEAARHAGVNLYTDRYRKLYDAPLALALPNGDSPGFNDSAGGNIATYGPLYELAFARWNRPEYGRVAAGTSRESLQALLYGAEKVPDGPVVPETSALLATAGYAMLRAGGTAAAVRFGMHGGGHGHPDKLNLVTYGAGRLFGLDPGSINYGVPLHREWYRSTVAHNTVSVDGRLQANADGRLEEWRPEGGAPRLAAGAGEAYPGVRLVRRIRVRKNRVEDRFECESAEEHTYDWVFHAPGTLTTSLKLAPRAGRLGESAGYQHIREVAEGKARGGWWARWENGGSQLTLRVRGTPGTTVYTGYGPGKNPAEAVPLVIVRRRAKATVFEVTHEFQGGGGAR
ncbi:MAG: heparinase II/III family protein, partial [Bryobacterales bacterium]|nr:heparinase II/III family protein [Bryobacterales bacterium]